MIWLIAASTFSIAITERNGSSTPNVCLLNREATSLKHVYVGVSLDPTSSGGARVSTQADARGDSPVRSGSPAAQAGLRPGDHVTAISLKSIASTDDFIATVDGCAPAARITLTIKHGGQAKTLRLTLGARPTSATNGG